VPPGRRGATITGTLGADSFDITSDVTVTITIDSLPVRRYQRQEFTPAAGNSWVLLDGVTRLSVLSVKSAAAVQFPACSCARTTVRHPEMACNSLRHIEKK
jgi:hypothetical protein